MPDITYSTVLGLTWSGMERNIAILIGSVPALNPLLVPVGRYIRETLGSSTTGTKSEKSYPDQISKESNSRRISDADN
ncbi:hypothetical protein RRF57_010690 [Xylaria bambusicola]|uniref:Uncharacterized protein n=1 Tax=Xylaria bambusicola TaxID=326684 RepID=A0AAN7USU4_9PEZI